jgi:uncharacterized membrane protein
VAGVRPAPTRRARPRPGTARRTAAGLWLPHRRAQRKGGLGFAVYALCLGTVLVLTGAVVFISQGRWLLLGLMVLIEAVFVFAFSRLARQARNRRSTQ